MKKDLRGIKKSLCKKCTSEVKVGLLKGELFVYCNCKQVRVFRARDYQ